MLKLLENEVLFVGDRFCRPLIINLSSVWEPQLTVCATPRPYTRSRIKHAILAGSQMSISRSIQVIHKIFRFFSQIREQTSISHKDFMFELQSMRHSFFYTFVKFERLKIANFSKILGATSGMIGNGMMDF